MPSERQLEHLKKLNSLPQVHQKRFQKGRVPHNKGLCVVVECGYCGKRVKKKPAQAKRSKINYCSRQCAELARPAPTREKALELYKSGKKLREIAEELGVTTGTISTALYRGKLRACGRNGNGKCGVKSALPKACELCGYDRTVEVAHIVPVRDGGTYSIKNCFALCSNCHALFDHGRLNREELKRLEEINNARENG